MIHLFIDSNIYIKLFSFKEEQLKEIKELIEQIKNKNIILYLPEQVINEVWRNRENTLYNYFTNIDQLKPKVKISNIPESKEKTSEIKKIIDKQNIKIDKKIQQLKDEFKNKIKNYSFLADNIIKELFKYARHIDTIPQILIKANQRFKIGNPPGKIDSLGDAIIWESLLSVSLEKQELHFIADDSHFTSLLDKDEFCLFLLDEWQCKNKSDIILYKRLGEFTKEHVPKIKTSDKIIEGEVHIDEEQIKILSEGLENITKITQDFAKRLPKTMETIADAYGNLPPINPLLFSGINKAMFDYQQKVSKSKSAKKLKEDTKE